MVISFLVGCCVIWDFIFLEPKQNWLLCFFYFMIWVGCFVFFF